MRMGTYGLAVMAILALAGCASTGIESGGKVTTQIHCPGNVCDFIDVEVAETGTTANPQCKVTKVSVDKASVAGQAPGDKQIRWRLIQGSLYQFSKADYKFGIFIKGGSDPTGKFQNVTINDNALSIRFKHGAQADAREYSYSITVRRISPGNPDPQFCETLDPFLVG